MKNRNIIIRFIVNFMVVLALVPLFEYIFSIIAHTTCEYDIVLNTVYAVNWAIVFTIIGYEVETKKVK